MEKANCVNSRVIYIWVGRENNPSNPARTITIYYRQTIVSGIDLANDTLKRFK